MLLNIYKIILEATNTKMYVLFVCLMFLRLAVTVSQHSQVLVISFDGFRHDYFERNLTPVLARLRMKGTHAEYMRNVFLTKTFPNHHSIATGVYPEVHGVVSNSCYDPRLNKTLGYSEELWTFNDTNLPIWILNEKAGNGRYSGCYMWPGSDFKYQNTSPTFHVDYNTSVKFQDRVDTVISWFLHPNTPANLIMFYFEEPDKLSHPLGPDSSEVNDTLRSLDIMTNYLLQQLSDCGLAVNIIFLSDHGMTSVTAERIINVTHIVHKHEAIMAGTSPALHVVPTPDNFQVLYNELKELSITKNFTVYRKEDLLDRWHFKKNIRVPPILLLADEGYGFDDLLEYEDLEDMVENNHTFGSHGYDNAIQSMHPFFFAWGPRVRRNYTIAPFDTVDLYSLFCRLLDLDIPPTDGFLANVESMLTLEEAYNDFSLPLKVVAVVAITVLLLACACCVTHQILQLSRKPQIRTYRLLDPPGVGRFYNKDMESDEEEQHLLEPGVP